MKERVLGYTPYVFGKSEEVIWNDEDGRIPVLGSEKCAQRTEMIGDTGMSVLLFVR